ncbi:hypothetical protein DT250_18250 [Bacillus sp. AR2-1]|uniref:hypothetical protein n=1 Tax=Bacillus sp. AR2-1 TaxID=2217816 RepID=UPI0011ECCC75|nr:hypothetical protein [Bacillus sp. AR2-1]KAA0767619.1 hypothetical protein DT250_18250 [Bacillus sp. AR2-1]
MKKACQIKYYKIEGKMKYPLIYFFNSFIKSIELGAVLFITLALLQQLKILNLKWIENVFNHLPNVNQELNRQFLFSQISVTFIILSLFSLIINLKKEKVLGTSIYQIVFARSILGNIKFISLSVFFFLFINITLYINDSSSSAILYVFLITLSLLTLLIIKIIFYSNSQKLSANKIVSIYNRENTKLVRKPRIVWKSGVRFSEYLYNLNEDTIEKILRGDVEYKRNLYVYEKIANLSLVNYKYKVQENYTETIYESDIILMWVSAIEELIKKELYTDSINQYNKMIALFISHEVYLSSSQINQLLKQIFISISVAESKVVFEQNKAILLTSIRLTMKYGYFKLNNDFSYTRLGKLKDMLYLNPLYGDFMIDYYNLIDKNTKFDDLEKSERISDYFESLRMMSYDIRDYFTMDIKFYEVGQELKKYNEEDISLVGIPLSNLLLLIMQEDKKGRALYFLNYYNNNSIYFACLIVASKLATLYLQIKDNDKSNRKIVEGYLLLVLSKLFEVDNQKIKYYCYVIKQTMNDDRIYGEVYFTQENMKLLSVIKQAIMIRKNRVDIKNTSFSNWRLREIVNLFSTRYNSNLLKKEQEKANREVIDKFGVLIHLL